MGDAKPFDPGRIADRGLRLFRQGQLRQVDWLSVFHSVNLPAGDAVNTEKLQIALQRLGDRGLRKPDRGILSTGGEEKKDRQKPKPLFEKGSSFGASRRVTICVLKGIHDTLSTTLKNFYFWRG